MSGHAKPWRIGSGGHAHAPLNPSGLRESHVPGSDDEGRDQRPKTTAGPSQATPGEMTALLAEFPDAHAHDGPCDHGTFSPRPTSPACSDGGNSGMLFPSDTEADTDASSVPGRNNFGGQDRRRGWKNHMKSRKMKTSQALAEQHGVRHSVVMYLSYYFPVLVWGRAYKWTYLKSDFVAALTVAGMYLPVALSLADNLAHVPPINGLYSFVFNPFMYAMLGSCPSMVVGPEAAGALLVGTVVKSSVDNGRGEDDDAVLHAKICGVVAGMAGATVFIAGLARLGFLDSVLSRPFLRGFISAIGFVIAVEQLLPELGLAKLASHTPGIGHGSSVDKLTFIFTHLDRVHGATAALAGASFAVIMLLRHLKHRLQPRYPAVAYFPDRFLVVVLSAFLTWFFDWEARGVAVLGKVEAASGALFTFRWPFRLAHMTHIRDAMGTSFLIALLGFFESSVAAKSLGKNEAFPDVQLSANRELVALGAANLVGACFMALPAFGGYGRSKVNKSTGGKSPMSSVFLSLLSLACILFLLPAFYYLPKPVLAALISAVAWSLIEELPHDVSFFLRIRAWPELGLILIIVLATIFFSLSLGMAIGIGLSLLQVIRHATRPRIQILGRIPGTHRFENAEAGRPDKLLEFFDGCLIVKIPEPLTFANTGEIKNRLRRLEVYGSSEAHPALPRLRSEAASRNIIFDIHGVTGLDGSGVQVLEEIVRDYRERDVRVFFSRGPSKESAVWRLLRDSGIVDLTGGEAHFVDDVQDALRLTEVVEGPGEGA